MSRLFKELYWSIKSMGNPEAPHKLSLRELITVYTPGFIWDIIYSVENFFLWIRKSFAYAWMLRQDRDWHDGDIIRLIHFKLTRVRKALIGNSYRTEEHDKEMAEYIDRMLFLFDRILKNEYLPELDANFTNVFGEVVSHTTEEVGPNGVKHSYFEMNYQNTSTKEERELASKEQYAISIKQEEAKKADVNEVFDLFKQYNRLWD